MERNETIADRIGKLIVKRDCTQQELADGIGVKRETVVQWLNSTRKIKAEHIIALCDFFGVSADYLLCRSDVESLDTNLQAVCNYTGLSESAINNLLANFRFNFRPSEISLLLENNSFLDLLDGIDGIRYCYCKVANAIDTLQQYETEPEDDDNFYLAEHDLNDFLGDFRMSVFESKEAWAEVLENLFDVKNTVYNGKTVMMKFEYHEPQETE